MVFGGGLTVLSSSEEEETEDVDDDGGGGFFWAGLMVFRATGLVFGGGLTLVSSSEEESEDDDGGAGFWAGLLVESTLEGAGVEEGGLGADFWPAVFLGGSSSSLLLLLESEEETLFIWDFLFLTVCSTGSGLFLVDPSGVGVTVEFFSFIVFFFFFFFSVLCSCDFVEPVLLKSGFLTFSAPCSWAFFLFFFLNSVLTPLSSGPSSSVGLRLFLPLSLVSSR